MRGRQRDTESGRTDRRTVEVCVRAEVGGRGFVLARHGHGPACRAFVTTCPEPGLLHACVFIYLFAGVVSFRARLEGPPLGMTPYDRRYTREEGGVARRKKTLAHVASFLGLPYVKDVATEAIHGQVSLHMHTAWRGSSRLNRCTAAVAAVGAAQGACLLLLALLVHALRVLPHCLEVVDHLRADPVLY